MQVASTVPLLFLPRSLSFPLTNHGQIFNCMSLIYNPPPTPIVVVVVASRSNHRSHCLKPQTRYRFSRSCHHCYPSLSLKLSLSTSFTICVLSEEGANFFFVLISTPPPNPPDLIVAVLHPFRSLSFPQSLTLSSSSHRVYHVYAVNKCFYFDFWLC